MAKDKTITVDELAGMIQKGFEGITSNIDELRGGLDEVKNDAKAIKKDVSIMATEIDNLQRGQEHIQDRLDEMVTRGQMKEPTRTLKEHDKRIQVLEKKVLLAG